MRQSKLKWSKFLGPRVHSPPPGGLALQSHGQFIGCSHLSSDLLCSPSSGPAECTLVSEALLQPFLPGFPPLWKQPFLAAPSMEQTLNV